VSVAGIPKGNGSLDDALMGHGEEQRDGQGKRDPR